jgi:NAD+ kinase
MVLAIGGDGTLLRAAERARPLSAPILGINLGRVGFLTEVDVDHVDAALQAVIEQRYRVSSRMTVEVSVEHQGRFVTSGWALNEISVEKVTRERILDVVVEVDGHGVSAYGCDGVLCATPTGSTAYAFSAGGPVVWPDVQALLVVPSNAHALFARPLVVSPRSTVAFEVDPNGHPAVLCCDGRRTFDLPAGTRVEVVGGKTPIKLVRLREGPFADRLVEKFSLPVQGWRGPSVG